MSDADAENDPSTLLAAMDANPDGVAAEIPGYDTKRLVADSVREITGTLP